MNITFGATAKPLAEQGVPINKRDIALLQRMADALTLLAVQQVLSDSEATRARKRLCKWIQGRQTP